MLISRAGAEALAGGRSTNQTEGSLLAMPISCLLWPVIRLRAVFPCLATPGPRVLGYRSTSNLSSVLGRNVLSYLGAYAPRRFPHCAVSRCGWCDDNNGDDE